MLLGLEAPWKLLGGVQYDANANLMRGHNRVIRYSYKVVTTPTAPPVEMSKLTLSEIESRVRNEDGDGSPSRPALQQFQYFLQMPGNLRNTPFFVKWVNEVGINPATTTLAKAMETLQLHFQHKFRATLLNQFSEGVPFRSFLEKDRQGHCEYFSTAAALFLRYYGVPTRIVVGYRGGTFNRLSKVLEVREENAHAWVEVYVPGTGWARFDPTPIGAPSEAEGLPNHLLLYLNAAKFWFNRYVVNYDSDTQKDLMKSLFTLKKPMRWLGDIVFNPKKLILALVADISCGISAFGIC